MRGEGGVVAIVEGCGFDHYQESGLDYRVRMVDVIVIMERVM